MKPFIYMDHAATTPVRAEVLDAMLPYFSEQYGNPSSTHSAGRKASVGLTKARRTVAALLGVAEREIIFTSGGTEGANAAIRGIALARRQQTGANHIITSAVEHHAVLHTVQDLAANYGFVATILPVDGDGLVQAADVERAICANGGEGGPESAGNNVALVTVMYANNEVGTIQPVAAIGALCRQFGIPFHTDAVQAAATLAIDAATLPVDALSLSAHKIYGPKGVGILYLRNGTPFLPTQTGGAQEENRRAGTENVPLIVGAAKALELITAERAAERGRLRTLRDRLIGAILEEVAGARLTGSRTQRLDALASFVIAGVDAEELLIRLDLAGIGVSSGSACTSGALRPSHVLDAMGIPSGRAAAQLRLSLGRSNTPQQIEYVVAQLVQITAQR
ncbi:MAG: cysteine desulfurase family protein [Caldilineaceae bacterium]